MFKSVVMIFLAVVLLCSSAYSFDGERKGFVLGGGMGFAPAATFKIDGTNFSETIAGFAVHLVIGYAWDEQNMVVYEGNVASYSIALLDGYLVQGFNGAAIYHYFGEKGKAPFLVGGLGAYVLNAEKYDDNNPGGGLLIGGGFEFAPHWQFGCYFSFKKTSDPFFDYKHSTFSVMVSGIAF